LQLRVRRCSRVVYIVSCSPECCTPDRPCLCCKLWIASSCSSRTCLPQSAAFSQRLTARCGHPLLPILHAQRRHAQCSLKSGDVWMFPRCWHLRSIGSSNTMAPWLSDRTFGRSIGWRASRMLRRRSSNVFSKQAACSLNSCIFEKLCG